MDTIVRAIPLEDFLLDILTSSGVQGLFDLKSYLGDSAFAELRDPACFRLVQPAHHGIRWPHDQEISSDTILWDLQQRVDTDRAPDTASDLDEYQSSALPTELAPTPLHRGKGKDVETT